MSITFFKQLNVDNVDNFKENKCQNCVILLISEVMHHFIHIIHKILLLKKRFMWKSVRYYILCKINKYAKIVEKYLTEYVFV